MRLKDLNPEDRSKMLRQMDTTMDKIKALRDRCQSMRDVMDEFITPLKSIEEAEKFVNSKIFLQLKENMIDLNNVERPKLDNMMTNCINFYHEIFELEHMIYEDFFFDKNSENLKEMMFAKDDIRLTLLPFDEFNKWYEKQKDFQ